MENASFDTLNNLVQTLNNNLRSVGLQTEYKAMVSKKEYYKFSITNNGNFTCKGSVADCINHVKGMLGMLTLLDKHVDKNSFSNNSIDFRYGK